jgi:hypothetical protein
VSESEFTTEVELLDFAANASLYGASARLKVWTPLSLRHLVVGLKNCRERFLLKFRGCDSMPFTYMFAVQDKACLFQDPGDGTIIAGKCNPDAAPEFVIVEEPQWGLVFALPQGCFQSFLDAVAAMEEVTRTGKIADPAVFTQDNTCFPKEFHG